jgi:hypothetical protein
MMNNELVLSATFAACLLWSALVNTRPAPAQVSLSIDSPTGDTETRIEAALTRRVTFELVDWPLREVVEKVATQTGITIRLSKKIEDAGVQPDQRVTISARDVSAETFLTLVLRDLNLSLIVKHDALLVTTTEDAQSPENMVTRVYPVADLVELVRIPASQGGGVEMDFDSIIDMITSTVEPDSWQDVGGPGSITGFENSRSLVISNRRDLHQRIAALIVTLRRSKGLQGIRAFQPQVDPSPRSTTPIRLSSPLPVPGREKSAPLRIRPASRPPETYGGGGLF